MLWKNATSAFLLSRRSLGGNRTHQLRNYVNADLRPPPPPPISQLTFPTSVSKILFYNVAFDRGLFQNEAVKELVAYNIIK